MSHKITRIVVAEDTTLVRRLLVQQFTREVDFQVVGEASNGKEAVALTLSDTPDIVVMDLDMPVMNGIEATERIRLQSPETRVVLLTMHRDLATVGRMAGAAECLPKDCTPSELIAVIRRVAASEAHFAAVSGTPEMSARTRSRIDMIAVRHHLTDRETAVLERAVGTECTGGEIAHALSAERGERVSEAAVKHALERIMNKIGVEPRTRLTLVRAVFEAQLQGEA